MLTRLAHKIRPPRDPKPWTVTVRSTDGQYHTFKLGPGDGVGYAGIRIDAHRNQLEISHYTEG